MVIRPGCRNWGTILGAVVGVAVLIWMMALSVKLFESVRWGLLAYAFIWLFPLGYLHKVSIETWRWTTAERFWFIIGGPLSTGYLFVYACVDNPTRSKTDPQRFYRNRRRIRR